MLALICIVFGLLVADTEEDKTKKRRIQNQESAKKSYEAKKKHRQYLLQKHAELEEAQKDLLHSKFQLETTLRMLQHVADTMIHAYSSCSSWREMEQTNQRKGSIHEIDSITLQNSDWNNCFPLDLSVHHRSSPLVTSSARNRQRPGKYNDEDGVLCVDNKPNLTECKRSFMKIKGIPSDDDRLSKQNAIQDATKIIDTIDIKKESLDVDQTHIRIKLEVVD